MHEDSRCDCHQDSRDCGNKARQQLAVGTADEVLEFLTGVMRGEESGNAQNMKAAELLGKRFGLFNEQAGERPPPMIIDDVGGCDGD